MSHFSIKRLFLYTLISLSALCNASAADDDMPVIALWGISENYATDERIKEFADAGFNVSVGWFSSTERFRKALDLAEKYNVKLMFCSNQVTDNTASAIPQVKDHKALFGYYVYDEPCMKDYDAAESRISEIRKYDNNSLCYINLNPNYDDWSMEHIGTTDYRQYLRKFAALNVGYLSFDFYPVTDKGIRERWYASLEDIRYVCKERDIPFWAFVLCTPHLLYPTPTMESLRLQIYSNLAYGAQAIQYYTYWTPNPDKVCDYHDGPIGTDGKKTATYSLVKNMNTEMKPVASLFLGAKVTRVEHTGRVPDGCTRFRGNISGIRSLSAFGSDGVIVSQFEKGGHKYLALVNRDLTKNATVVINGKSSSVRHLTKLLVTENARDSYMITPGDIELFRLK